MYRYETPSWISAATTGKGEELDEARAFGVGAPLVLPRQTHSDHVVRVSSSCRPEDTDAVFIKELVVKVHPNNLFTIGVCLDDFINFVVFYAAPVLGIAAWENRQKNNFGLRLFFR